MQHGLYLFAKFLPSTVALVCLPGTPLWGCPWGEGHLQGDLLWSEGYSSAGGPPQEGYGPSQVALLGPQELEKSKDSKQGRGTLGAYPLEHPGGTPGPQGSAWELLWAQPLCAC